MTELNLTAEGDSSAPSTSGRRSAGTRNDRVSMPRAAEPYRRVRSRVFKIAVAVFCGYALLVEAIRHRAKMGEALFWPGMVVAGILALHFAVLWLF